MATVTKVKTGDQQKALNAKAKAGARTLSSGLSIVPGKYRFTTAEADAFGILNVESQATGKAVQWALPIVAGSMKIDGKTEKFVLSAEPNSNTLVIPDQFYTAMVNNAVYDITIEKNGKGRSVVTKVEAIEGGASSGETEGEEQNEY